MRHTRLQIFHVRRRKCVLTQPRCSYVDLLHSPTELFHERSAFAREVVDASFTRTADICVPREIRLWLPGRHRYIYEPIAKQTGTSDGKFRPFGDLNVIINLQRYVHALAFANHSRTTRDFSNLRAREQNVGAFQQPARIIEANGERIISSKAFAETPELHNQRTEHR